MTVDDIFIGASVCLPGFGDFLVRFDSLIIISTLSLIPLFNNMAKYLKVPEIE